MTKNISTENQWNTDICVFIEANSEPSQTYKMELSATFAESSILYGWLCSEFTSASSLEREWNFIMAQWPLFTCRRLLWELLSNYTKSFSLEKYLFMVNNKDIWSTPMGAAVRSILFIKLYTTDTANNFSIPFWFWVAPAALRHYLRQPKRFSVVFSDSPIIM